jgi:hypothetical protein
MTDHKKLGFWRRFFAACKRGLLGKSGHDYMTTQRRRRVLGWRRSRARRHQIRIDPSGNAPRFSEKTLQQSPE